MKKIINIAAIFMLALCCWSCSSSDDDEEQPTNVYTYDEILGTWISTSYLCSDGYFIPVHGSSKDTLVFNENQTYTYNEEEHGTFVYNEHTKVIWCKDSRGWDMEISISFADSEHATFAIKGKTGTASMTLKMERI